MDRNLDCFPSFTTDSGKEKKMEEMKDYSGPFDPDMKLENLSKEALMNLVEVDPPQPSVLGAISWLHPRQRQNWPACYLHQV